MVGRHRVTRAAAWIGAAAIVVAGLVSIPTAAQAVGTTYYVNNTPGSGCSNSGTGTTTAQPWCNFTNVNSHTFVPGDVLSLARGASWTSTLDLAGTGTTSNWITVNAYGTGALPIIRGNDVASDRTVIMTNPDYWIVKDLEVSHAGMGIIVNYTTLNHQGLRFSGIYAHDINTIFDQSPVQTDFPSLYDSAGIIIGGINAPPVPSSTQWVVKDINVSNYTANNTNPFWIWTMQSGGVYSNYPTNSVQNVTVQNSSFTNMPAPGFDLEAASNVNFFSNVVDCSGHIGEPQGTTCFFLWDTTNTVFANNIFKNMPDTGSNDETAIDSEGYTDRVITRGNYFANNAGAATEYLQLGGRPGDFSTNHQVTDNAFTSNGIGAGKLGTSLWVQGGASVTGTVQNNFYAESNGLTSGTTSGLTLTNNLSIGASQLFSAPTAFSSTQGANNELYELDNAGTYSGLTYTSGTNSWSSSAGIIGQFDTTPTTSSAQWVSRTWSAPSSGTISVRGWALKSAAGGDGVFIRITKNGTVVWPTSGGSQSIGATDQVGFETALDGLTVVAGDKIRFEVNSGGSANATSDATSWAPSIGYNTVTTSPQSLVAAVSLGTLRNNATGLAGLKFTTDASSKTVSALGRYFVAGNTGTHSLSLYSGSGSTLLASCSVSMSSSSVDPLGFDYCALSSNVTLAPGTTYYLVSSETSGGDYFSGDNSSITLSTGTRDSSIYQSGGAWGAGIGSGEYGPVNLLFTTSLLSAATLGTSRNNATAPVGMKFTTGSGPMYVTSLGRYFLAGNSGTHLLALYASSTGSLIASCSVAMGTGSTDSLGFKYCQLSAPVVLSPGTTCFLVTNETSGGDAFSDDNSSVSFSTGLRNSSIYFSGGSWSAGTGGGSYGPVTLR